LLADPAWFVRPGPPESPTTGERTWVAVPGCEIRLHVEEQDSSPNGMQFLVAGKDPDGAPWTIPIRGNEVSFRTMLPGSGKTQPFAVIGKSAVAIVTPTPRRGAARDAIQIQLRASGPPSFVRVHLSKRHRSRPAELVHLRLAMADIGAV